MFDLEQSISGWRQQMLAAGIQTPVPLEELEIHLREEIEQRMQSGISEQEAFAMASAIIGQPEPLKSEFKRAGGLLSWLGEDRQQRINRSFALPWLAYCSWGFFSVAKPISIGIYVAIFGHQHVEIDFGLYLALLLTAIWLRGIIASVLLPFGKNREIWIILCVAGLGILAFFAQIIVYKTISTIGIALTLLNLATIGWLRPTKREESSPAGK
jgi:hypothetical protein